tara:strand:- start:34 stop:1134 length:1101 start_codon:yes stop_codon:yes gene_type:complete
MAISTTVTAASDVKVGILGEATFGTVGDVSGSDGQAYRTLPMVTATKPTFNITRESRLLSGRGNVKNAADTVITRKNGTVVTPFEFIATPELLLQHLVMVTNTYNADGSNVYTVEVDGSNNLDSVGGSISGKVPHTVNLAYDTGVSAAGIDVPGNTVSDLTISGDYGSSGGNLTMSGNYFSGFANAPSVGSTGAYLERTYDGTWVYPDEGSFFNIGSLSTKQLDCDSTSNTQDMILKSFTLNFANGVNRIGSNTDGNAEGYSFPEYAVTGDITLKYDTEFGLIAGANVVQSFLDGNTVSLALKFGDGTVSSVTEMNILAECQVTGDPATDMSENGVYWTIPFECVQNSSTEAIKISLFSDTAIGSM